MFAPRMPILGVRDAIVRIGISAVRDVVVMVVASSKMFRLPGFESHLEVLRRRMLAAAPSARALARALRTQPEAGFLTGLLHDIGELLLLERCAQKGILTPAIWSDPVEGETARERIHAHHTAVGAALCRSWKLPASVVDAAQFHHDYRSGGKTHLPAHLAAASDALREYVLPNAARPETPAEEHPVLLELGLTPAQILNALDEARPASAALIATR